MKPGDLVKLKKYRGYPNGELLGIITNCSQFAPGVVKVLLLKKQKKIVSVLKTNVIVINESG